MAKTASKTLNEIYHTKWCVCVCVFNEKSIYFRYNTCVKHFQKGTSLNNKQFSLEKTMINSNVRLFAYNNVFYNKWFRGVVIRKPFIYIKQRPDRIHFN